MIQKTILFAATLFVSTINAAALKTLSQVNERILHKAHLEAARELLELFA